MANSLVSRTHWRTSAFMSKPRSLGRGLLEHRSLHSRQGWTGAVIARFSGNDSSARNDSGPTKITDSYLLCVARASCSLHRTQA